MILVEEQQFQFADVVVQIINHFVMLRIKVISNMKQLHLHCLQRNPNKLVFRTWGLGFRACIIG